MTPAALDRPPPVGLFRVRKLNSKRTKKHMLRLSGAEEAALLADKPDHVPAAVHLRDKLLQAVDLRRTAAFIVAALSADEMSLEDALKLFDEHARGGQGVGP